MYLSGYRNIQRRPAVLRRGPQIFRENPEEAAGYSIKQLADKTFSSAATIVRLCRKMGFDGYKELQKSLLYESALRRESTRPMEQEIKRTTAWKNW